MDEFVGSRLLQQGSRPEWRTSSWLCKKQISREMARRGQTDIDSRGRHDSLGARSCAPASSQTSLLLVRHLSPRFGTSSACAEIHAPGIQPVEHAATHSRTRRRIVTRSVDTLPTAATQNFRLFPRYLSPGREPPAIETLLQPHKQKRRVSRETRRPFPAHRRDYQAVFFANPRYVSITRGFCASSAAGPSSANSPVSST